MSRLGCWCCGVLEGYGEAPYCEQHEPAAVVNDLLAALKAIEVEADQPPDWPDGASNVDVTKIAEIAHDALVRATGHVRA